MTGINVRYGVALLAGTLIGTQAIGQAAPPAAPKANAQDEMVCEKIEVIGSRLQTKKVCMTRAQWAERRLEDRMDLDKRQIRGLRDQ